MNASEFKNISFLSLIFVIQEHLKMVLFFTVIGGGAGLLLYFTAKPTYSTQSIIALSTSHKGQNLGFQPIIDVVQIDLLLETIRRKKQRARIELETFHKYHNESEKRLIEITVTMGTRDASIALAKDIVSQIVAKDREALEVLNATLDEKKRTIESDEATITAGNTILTRMRDNLPTMLASETYLSPELRQTTKQNINATITYIIAQRNSDWAKERRTKMKSLEIRPMKIITAPSFETVKENRMKLIQIVSFLGMGFCLSIVVIALFRFPRNSV